MKPSDLAHADRALLERELADVTPISAPPVHDLRKPPPKPIPRQTLADEARVPYELLTHGFELIEWDTGEELNYAQNGVSEKTRKKLKRGQFAIQATLDLHGFNVEQARAELLQFLKAASERRMRCVRIIHGKGHGSKGQGATLKPLTDSLLRRVNLVLAFTSAPPHDGGTGAVYVLLR
jgi:DNA-nicking Smr family endonuclease